MPHRILVVDSDGEARERTSELLTRHGYGVQAVEGASPALELLRRDSYDLVVAADGTDGGSLEFLGHARAVCNGAKAIILGQEDPARVLDAMRGHAYSYFHQPVSENAFLDMVHRAVAASGWEHDMRLVSALPDWLSLYVRCTLDAAERTVQFVRETEISLPGGACEQVASAFRELLLNAVEHGGGLDPGKRVRAALIRTTHALVGHVQDPGPGFSLDRLPHAAISNPGDAPIRHVEVRAERGQRPGGFGILMCRSMVDELRYSERGNQVVFVKYLK